MGHSCENKKDDCNGLIKEMNSTICVNPDIVEIEVNGCNPKNSSEDNFKASHNTGLTVVELEKHKKQQKKVFNINRTIRINKSNQLQNIFKRETKKPRRPYEKYAPKPSRIPRNQQNDKRYLAKKHENQQETKNQQSYKYVVQNRFWENVASREDKPGWIPNHTLWEQPKESFTAPNHFSFYKESRRKRRAFRRATLVKINVHLLVI